MIPTATLDSIVVPLQLAGLEQQLSQVIGQVLAFLPVVLSAIVVLVVGYVVGRMLEAIVVRILDSIGLSDYTGGTALETSGGGADSNERSGRSPRTTSTSSRFSPPPTSCRFRYSRTCWHRSARSSPSSSARSSSW